VKNRALKNTIEFDTLIIDSVPSMIFILDSSMNIVKMNRAAFEYYSEHKENQGKERVGNVLNCIYSLQHPEGCGMSSICGSCMVRNAVLKAVNGEDTRKRKARINHGIDDTGSGTYYCVSSNRILFGNSSYTLLVLEDITELITLKGMIPICASCKKVRDDEGFWERIEHYLESKSDLTFSHSICPECTDKIYPEFADKKLTNN
jgi:PAS domain-containing protein